MNDTDNSKPYSYFSLAITALAIFGALAFGWLSFNSDLVWITVAFLSFQTILVSIIIWQACDPFADAAQWIGVRYRLPGSVRGATLDAIASSMPELFTGIFFVLLAIFASDISDEQLSEAGGEGFNAALATCAGSAVYNMILIPAFCVIVISIYRRSRPTIDIEDRVIARDGMWFVACEVVLVFFLFNNSMHWWMGLILIGMYLAYVLVLYQDAKRFQTMLDRIEGRVAAGESVDQVVRELRGDGERISRDLVERAKKGEYDEEEQVENARVLFGAFSVPLNTLKAWTVIAISTCVAAAACYWLVYVTRSMADELDVPVFFVAVIIAGAASSVPDTFLSIASARKGDDDGAVSNAFGSNIFDIAICLSIPLLVASYLNGWDAIPLIDGEKPMQGLVGLRIMLLVLTFLTLLIMWHNRQLTWRKAVVLVILYLAFVGYAVAGSLGFWD